MVKKNHAVFLDRDGVLNRSIIKNKKPFAPLLPNQFILMPYVCRYLQILKKLNYILVVITNQPDLSSGKLLKSNLLIMHNKLIKLTPIDHIYFCPHSKFQNCKCRKPKIKFLLQAKNKYNINFKKSFFIGDRSIDILAGSKVGCKTIFIDRHYLEKKPLIQNITVQSFKSAVEYIINQ